MPCNAIFYGEKNKASKREREFGEVEWRTALFCGVDRKSPVIKVTFDQTPGGSEGAISTSCVVPGVHSMCTVPGVLGILEEDREEN